MHFVFNFECNLAFPHRTLALGGRWNQVVTAAALSDLVPAEVHARSVERLRAAFGSVDDSKPVVSHRKMPADPNEKRTVKQKPRGEEAMPIPQAN